MSEAPWEIDAPSLAITVRWGDVALHTAHLGLGLDRDPPRSFFLGDATADCVLPDGAVGPGRVPLVVAERGALYLVLLPSMDPEGTITAPGRAPRSVADLARPGMAEASRDVPGAFLVPLVPGMTAELAIGDFAIAVALETKAARAVAGHYHVDRGSVPFQIASAALHLALLAAAAFLMPPVDLLEDGPSSEQIAFMARVFQVIAEKEAALEESEGVAPYAGWGPMRSSSMRSDIMAQTWSEPDWRQARRRDGAGGLDAVDRDTVGYERLRSSLQRSEMPEPESVRAEEILNGVDHHYADPDDDAAPFAVHLDAVPSPFAAGHHLIRAGVQGRRSRVGARGPAARGAIVARELMLRFVWAPSVVSHARILGDEERDDDGREDRIYAGALRAGHSVTVVYDVVLGSTTSSPVTVRVEAEPPSGYEEPQVSVFKLAPRSIAPTFDGAAPSLRLAAAAAGLGAILAQRPFAEGWQLADVERIARGAAGHDDRARELVNLAGAARSLEEARAHRGRGGRVADASLLGF